MVGVVPFLVDPAIGIPVVEVLRSVGLHGQELVDGGGEPLRDIARDPLGVPRRGEVKDEGLPSLVEKRLSKEEIVESIARLLEENRIILKIMSCDLEDIERSSPMESLLVLKGELKHFQDPSGALPSNAGRRATSTSSMRPSSR